MKTVSFHVIAVGDAILHSLATSTVATALVTAALTGVIGGAVMFPPRTLTLNTTASVGTYILGSRYIVTGLDPAGHKVTETYTVTQVNGGETIVGKLAWSKILKVNVPAQLNTSGSVQIGVRDILMDSCTEVIVGTSANGQIKLGYADGSADTIMNIQPGTCLPVSPTRVYGDSGTTVSDVTLIFRGR